MSGSDIPADRWPEVDRTFQAACDLDESERSRFLGEACAGDQELRAWVETLLARDRAGMSWLDAAAAPPVPPAAPREGDSVGDYRLGRCLGEGGSAVVFEAQSKAGTLERRVAVKVLKISPFYPQSYERFADEGRLLARLEHPAIARVYEAGQSSEFPYLVMERVDGEPIDAYCRRLGLSAKQRADLLRRVCEPVAFAHRNLIVHRDLKPANVLITADGEPRLLDFGIAKLLSESEESPLTRTGSGPLTPAYASPEQLAGQPVTTATDVYSLGVVLYELLAGALPSGRDGGARPRRPSERLEREPELRQRTGLRPQEVAGDLDRIVLKAMAEAPAERYASVEALAEDLRRYGAGLPILARSPSWGYRLRKFVSRHPVATAAGAAAALVIAGLTVSLAARTVELGRERDRAAAERDAALQVAGFLTDIFRLSSPEANLGERLTARDLLDRGARRLESQLADQPQLRARLEEAIGSAYTELGSLAAARPLLERSLETRRQGGDRRELIGALDSLARLEYAAASDLPRAEELAREALDLGNEKLTLAPDRRARLHLSLSSILGRQGRLPEALEESRQALDDLSAAPSADPELLGEALVRRGNQMIAMGDLEGAARILDQGLTLLDTGADPPHPLLLEALLSQVRLLQARGEFSQARSVLERLLAGQRRLYGPDHPLLGETYSGLALNALALQQLAEAERWARTGLELRRRSSGEDHLSVAPSLSILAHVLAAEGKLDDARTNLIESLAITRRNLPSGSAVLANPLAAIGRLELRRQNPGPAVDYLREALALRQAVLPESHPELAESRIDLARALAAQGDRPAARQLLEAALAGLAGHEEERRSLVEEAKRRLEELSGGTTGN